MERYWKLKELLGFEFHCQEHLEQNWPEKFASDTNDTRTALALPQLSFLI